MLASSRYPTKRAPVASLLGIRNVAIDACEKLTVGVRPLTMFLSAIILVAVLVKSCVVETFFVLSSSMAPTLQIRDYIVVPKLSYGLHLPFLSRPVAAWAQPRRGDVVVFRRSDDPRTVVDESKKRLVKRVVAVAGDLIEVRGSKVLLNGYELYEPYARWASGGTHKEFTQRRVPPESVFVLGDNRDESQDSCSWRTPFVRNEQVLGRALFVY